MRSSKKADPATVKPHAQNFAATLTSDQAAILAENWHQGNVESEVYDRIRDIPFTLLASQHIQEIVFATGAVAPFSEKGDRQSRLKKAAYEGRIGSCAYEYRNNKVFRFRGREFRIPFAKEQCSLEKIFDSQSDKGLLVPKNGIVFVETDLEFRLPDFLALRFNLQIKHVHRGLLLGTGPLVDPGFFGKLCIPLHNLTDEDYFIGKDDGLIWVEFTKTSIPAGERDPARPPLDQGHFYKDIKEFIEKAAYRHPGEKIAIRSSLPSMFDQASRSAKKAESSAKIAAGVNVLAALAAVVGLGSLLFTAANFLSSTSGRAQVQLESLSNEVATLKDQNEALVEQFEAYERREAMRSEPQPSYSTDQVRRPDP